MCGRQRYSWHEVQDLYELPDGPARILQAHYNAAPTDPVEVVRPTAESARELVSMVVEKAPEGVAGKLQRKSGDRRRQAYVPGSVQAPSVRPPSSRL